MDGTSDGCDAQKRAQRQLRDALDKLGALVADRQAAIAEANRFIGDLTAAGRSSARRR